jgi:hypothetical protein
LIFLSAHSVQASPWDSHLKTLEGLDNDIRKLEEELDVLVDKKKNSRDQARTEEALQRIVEIHSELITARKSFDKERIHIEQEHKEQAHLLDAYDSRTSKTKKNSKKYIASPISSELDQLLIKVQLKFASFMQNQEPTKDVQAVQQVVDQKRKQKREREADVYLRSRSRVKLSK